ncbi:MAG: hypothetical protein D6732_23715 [Methanobacteriota archaeon]|nr:MAG: hypothetical protein D6732_23715 [Euryarchaeota archaeon]
MRSNFLALLCLVLCTLVKSQDSCYYRYENPELFKGEGVVFTERCHIPIWIPEKFTVFTLTESDIIAAEKLFFEKYAEYAKKEYDWTIKNVKRKYGKFNRQYIGLKDDRGTVYVLIQLLNFSKKRKAIKYFSGWDKMYIVGFGKFYEKNVRTVLVDITGKKVTKW